MNAELTYYFSTGSRYSYLSMSQVPRIERRYGVQFRWVPVNGKRIRRLRGVDPFQGPPQSGQYDWAYRERDALAWAELYDVAFCEPTDVEFDVELLLRAVIAAAHQGDVRAYAWQLAEEVFARGSWPLDQSVADHVAQRLGLDMQAFAASCEDPATQTTLEQNCAEAVDRGAFGTPSLFVGDELFWGNDRLPLVCHRLGQAEPRSQPFDVVALDHVVLRSSDPESLVAFYSGLLHAKVERTVGDFLWQLRIGDSLLDVVRIKSGERAGLAPSSGGANMDHFCLRIDPYDEVAILRYLQSAGVQGEAAGDIYGAQGMGPSVYFVDPIGNRVELKRHKPLP
jgi:2-hydroxychromene-2-carboxylate isomerase/catechol 2,3-dioxygenase-like lactoylglutathione lyase family enzyme